MKQLDEIFKDYGPVLGWRANFVVNLEGDFADSNESSRGISTPEDLALLIHLRKLSDVICVSAKSALAEQLGSTNSSTLAIVAGSHPVGDIPALSSSAHSVLVISPENRTSRESIRPTSNVKHVSVANQTVDRISPLELANAIEALGFKHPISEFGPAWLEQLVAEEIIDELCLTITKRTNQDFHEDSAKDAIQKLLPDSRFQLVSSTQINNNLFTRWTH